MNFPIELLLQCLPAELRQFIWSAAPAGRQYESFRLFLQQEPQELIEQLLYSVDWQSFRDHLALSYNIRGDRPALIREYIRQKQPDLLDVVLLINEIYGKQEVVATLKRSREVRWRIENNPRFNPQPAPSLYGFRDDEDSEFYPRPGRSRGAYASALEMAEDLYDIPDPRLVED